MKMSYSEIPYQYSTQRLSKKIIISGFDEKTSAKDLRIRFSVYGSIKDCYLYLNSNGKRQAYMTFYEVQSAIRAVRDADSNDIRLYHFLLMAQVNLENSKRLQLYLENHRGNTTSINELNNDCLLEIFSFIPILERCKLKKVCTRWHIIFKESLKTARYLNFTVSKNFKNCDGMTQNSSNNSDALDMEILAFNKTLTLNCLRKLIVGKEIRNKHILNQVLMVNQELRYLDIRNNSITSKSLFYLSEKIHTLIIKHCCNMQSDDLCVVIKQLKNLKCLKLRCRDVHHVLNIFNEYCENLDILELDFEKSPVYIDILLPITNLKRLKDLELHCVNGNIDTFLVKLSENCLKLNRLEINGSIRFGNMGRKAICALPKLQILAFCRLFYSYQFESRQITYSLGGITTNEIIRIVAHLPELRYLCLPYDWVITNKLKLVVRSINAKRCNDVPLELVYTMMVNSRTGRLKSFIYNGEFY